MLTVFRGTKGNLNCLPAAPCLQQSAGGAAYILTGSKFHTPLTSFTICCYISAALQFVIEMKPKTKCSTARL